jgi:hypothetical protein
MILLMYLTRRRTLLTLGALGGTAAAVRLGASPERPGGGLSPSSVVPLRAVELPLAGRLGADALGRVTGVLDVGRFRQLALTWEGELPGGLMVRTRSAGAWTEWQELFLTDHREETEGNGRLGTDLLWVDDADRVQVRVRGAAPRKLNLVAIDPGWLPSDEPELDLMSAGVAPRPYLLTRPVWGANESWRSGSPTINPSVKQVHVHHTATSNGYRPADVPALIRGMYRYHTQSLGWSDIGYNFLVDHWGRIWVGRAGGPRKAVQGAHTLGFNMSSCGVAAIGNFNRARPTKRMVTALVRLSAWKLDVYGHDPAEWIWKRSAGSDLYPEGKYVRLPRIDGHRHTNQTSCPGDYLFNRLPEIRKRARRRANAF